MSLRLLIETAPLGATLLVSNGQQKPPARFTRKLSNWHSENYAGTLVSIETGPSQRHAFTVREGEMDAQAPIVFQRPYGLRSFPAERRWNSLDVNKPVNEN